MKTLLIIEDDSLMTFCMEHQLRGNGFDIKTAENVKVARKKLKEQQIDCIISDISMDNYDDGIRFFEERLQNGDTTPTVFHSGGIEFKQLVLYKGALRFFSKSRTREMTSFIKDYMCSFPLSHT